MRPILLPALLSLALCEAARAATATTERTNNDLRAADLRTAFHDVSVEVGQAGSDRLSVTTQADGPGAAGFAKWAQPTITFQGGQLTLRPTGGVNVSLRRNVRGRVLLRLPPGAAQAVQTASGDVSLGGAAGADPPGQRLR